MLHITDTHPLIWFLTGDSRLSSATHTILRDPETQLIVPAMVLLEIAYLYSRRRIPLDLPSVLNHLNSAVNCTIAALDEDVIRYFPDGLDIHDAAIISTALYYRDALGEDVTVLTKDNAITNSGLVTVLW